MWFWLRLLSRLQVWGRFAWRQQAEAVPQEARHWVNDAAVRSIRSGHSSVEPPFVEPSPIVRSGPSAPLAANWTSRWFWVMDQLAVFESSQAAASQPETSRIVRWQSVERTCPVAPGTGRTWRYTFRPSAERSIAGSDPALLANSAPVPHRPSRPQERPPSQSRALCTWTRFSIILRAITLPSQWLSALHWRRLWQETNRLPPRGQVSFGVGRRSLRKTDRWLVA